MMIHVAQTPVVSALLQRVQQTIRNQGLLVPGDHVLLAVSGGVDSVSMLRLILAFGAAWNLRVTVAHIDHGLRGGESDGDAVFVRELAADYGVPCVVQSVVVASHGQGEGRQQTLQERAREVRYRALDEIASAVQAEKVAVAHTADDQAETVLMWMLRGAGLTGLAGMPYRRGARIIRPLLDVRREQLVGFLRAEGVLHREDSSNAKSVYRRNRIRHDVMPVLKQVNPGLVGVLQRQAHILRDEEDYLSALARDSYARVSRETDHLVEVDRLQFVALPMALQRRVLRLVVQRLHQVQQGPSFERVESVLACIQELSRCGTLRLDDLELLLTRTAVRMGCLASRGIPEVASDSSPLALPIPGAVRWPATGQRVVADELPMNAMDAAECTRWRVRIDRETVTPPFLVRSWQAGDRFCPTGMKGHSKKVQDVFADDKVPRFRRGQIPVVVAPEGIVWVAGIRADERFRVCPSSRRVVTLELVERMQEEI
jgi:tRNA(Ile)-lysidine synthase